VTSFSTGTVSVIATATNAAIARISVGGAPHGVALTPDGAHAYVSNAADSAGVSVIDTATNRVTATIPVGIFPPWWPSRPTGARVYVTNFDSNYLERRPGVLTQVDIGRLV